MNKAKRASHVSACPRANRTFRYAGQVRHRKLARYAVLSLRWEELVKRDRSIFASLLAAVLLLLPSPIFSATTCVALPPLKPIHRICGVVFFPSGDRVADAIVTVLQEGTEIAVLKTNSDGKFSFDYLKPATMKFEFK